MNVGDHKNEDVKVGNEHFPMEYINLQLNVRGKMELNTYEKLSAIRPEAESPYSRYGDAEIDERTADADDANVYSEIGCLNTNVKVVDSNNVGENGREPRTKTSTNKRLRLIIMIIFLAVIVVALSILLLVIVTRSDDNDVSPQHPEKIPTSFTSTASMATLSPESTATKSKTTTVTGESEETTLSDLEVSQTTSTLAITATETTAAQKTTAPPVTTAAAVITTTTTTALTAPPTTTPTSSTAATTTTAQTITEQEVSLRSYIFNMFFSPGLFSSIQENIYISQRTWYPMRADGIRACFIKVRLLFDTNMNLPADQYIDLSAISYGGTNVNTKDFVFGSQGYMISKVTANNTFCIEYKCSGQIDPEFSTYEIDYTKVVLSLTYPTTYISSDIVYEADFVSNDPTVLNVRQTGTSNRIYTVYTPLVYSPDLGIYSSTTNLRNGVEDAKALALAECRSGKTQNFNDDNPEIGLAVIFRVIK